MKTNLAILLALATAPAFAGPSSPEKIDIQPPDQSSAWWLTIAPYGWVTATDGDMGVAGLVAPVDISFKDTLDDLELAFMLGIEGGFDRWAFGFDGLFATSSGSAGLPAGAAPYTEATVDFDQFFGRLHAGYQVLAGENAILTAFVGTRYSYLSSEIELSGPATADLNRDGSKSWIDPVIGLHGFWKVNERWFIHGAGDIGGFGVSSDLIWQANVALGYRFSDSVSALAGYRGLGVDYSNGGFLVDTIAHGPVIGLSFRF